MNLELISAFATAPGAGGTAMTMATGDPAAIRNASKRPTTGLFTAIQLVAMWTNAQLVGSTKLTFPTNDLLNGIKFGNVASKPDQKLGWGSPIYARPQDPLALTQIGSVTAGQIETTHMLWYYEDSPGVDANMINMAALIKRGVRYITVFDTLTAGAGTGGQYAGTQLLNHAQDNFRPDTEYALVGGGVAVRCGAVTLQGSDLGGLRVGFPGLHDNGNVTADFFSHLAEKHDLPLIPVINSANRGGINVQIVQDQALTAVPLWLNFVELAPGGK